MGRPSKYSDALADRICERLVEGESLRSICRDDAMPSVGTVCRWLGENAVFREQYERAREAQADTLADEMLDIADDGSNDWMERYDDDGGNVGWKVNGEAVARSKLRLDARKWIASKLKPKKYGERQSVEHSGPDGKAIEIEQRVKEDADAVASAIAGLAERVGASGVAGRPDA